MYCPTPTKDTVKMSYTSLLHRGRWNFPKMASVIATLPPSAHMLFLSEILSSSHWEVGSTSLPLEFRCVYNSSTSRGPWKWYNLTSEARSVQQCSFCLAHKNTCTWNPELPRSLTTLRLPWYEENKSHGKVMHTGAQICSPSFLVIPTWLTCHQTW